MPFSQASLTPRHLAVYERLQFEAARLPGARRLNTPYGAIWMSPIEAELYEAMLRASLQPVPQFCVEGFFLDFAFPGLGLAVEADGAVHLDPQHLQRDHWRDSILRRSGWTVLRFHGTTIVQRADNCAFVIRREFQTRTRLIAERARLEEARRAARREAWSHPLRTLRRWILGSGGVDPTPPSPPAPPST